MQGPVLDICWSDVRNLDVKIAIPIILFLFIQDGTKVFMASCDKQVKCWDLASNQTVQVAQHDAPIKTCHWVKAPNYTCLMTCSWDKTLKVIHSMKIDFFSSNQLFLFSSGIQGVQIQCFPFSYQSAATVLML